MTVSLPDIQINAMATARARKAIRLYAVLCVAFGRAPTAREVAHLTHAQQDSAVRIAGVKVASPDAWKVVEAIAGVPGMSVTVKVDEADDDQGKAMKEVSDPKLRAEEIRNAQWAAHERAKR